MTRSGSGTGLVVLWAVGLLAASAAMAVPLDLDDPTPRWVEVRFEISPADAPGRLDQEWSVARPAYLEPTAGGLIRIEVPAEVLEAHHRTTGTDAVPGTFGSFVWTLDTATGHVLDASLAGRIREPVGLGPMRTTVEVRIRVEMTTRSTGGFRPESSYLGRKAHAFCESAPAAARDCTLVPPRPLNPESGYVNAIGSVRAETPLIRLRAFSPLGEARFSERADRQREDARHDSRVARDADAVCFEAFSGPCRSVLGGES
jgi:hypothetical protein